MGLPFFVTPEDPKEVAKTVDKDAAQARSAIRRHRAARRQQQDSRSRDRNARQPIAGTAPYLLPDPQVGPNLTAVVPLSSSGVTRREAPVVTDFLRRRIPDASQTFPQTFLSFPGETDRPRDTVVTDLASFRPSQAHVRSDSREYRVIRRAEQLHRWTERMRGQNPQSPPPPLLNRRETSTDLGMNIAGTILPSFTAGFSPARPHGLQETLRPGSHSPPDYLYQSYTSAEDTGRAAALMRRDRNGSREHHPLPPMGRRSAADLHSGRRRIHRAPMDGLGDRDRSISPDGDVVWETMLTTLTPDPQLPSVGSSFTSSSAVTSASSSNESSSTSITTIGSGRSPTDAINTAMDNICDLIEDTQESSAVEDTDLEDEEDLYELRDGQGSSDRFWRSYADAMVSQVDRMARQQQGRGEADTLGGMQRIVRRLARREDIPDEWWAEAGLSRNFPRDSVRL